MEQYEEIGELIILHQLLKISSEKTRRILERQDAGREMDRARLERAVVGLDDAEDSLRCILRATLDRDRGEPCGPSPPTPPGMRVRTGRFERLRCHGNPVLADPCRGRRASSLPEPHTVSPRLTSNRPACAGI